jgi:hypothetical protein
MPGSALPARVLILASSLQLELVHPAAALALQGVTPIRMS